MSIKSKNKKLKRNQFSVIIQIVRKVIIKINLKQLVRFLLGISAFLKIRNKDMKWYLKVLHLWKRNYFLYFHWVSNMLIRLLEINKRHHHLFAKNICSLYHHQQWKILVYPIINLILWALKRYWYHIAKLIISIAIKDIS